MTRVLIIDGHPDDGRLISHLISVYQAALPAGTEVDLVRVRDAGYAPNLKRGFAGEQPWEPALIRIAEQVRQCDHLVVAFPLWWGAEPARLKGLIDRLLMPGFAFRYRKNSAMWDKLLQGRSADVFITMDTPPWYLRMFWKDPVGQRWRHQILEFCGFKPVRIFEFGMVRRGGVKRSLKRWERTLQKAASEVSTLKRGAKRDAIFTKDAFQAAMDNRKS